MLCPVCQKSNPDDNSFCGHCGQPLAMNQVPTNYPREGFDEVDEPEIQQIDPRIPANEYSQPRVNRKGPAEESFQPRVSNSVKASEPPHVTEPEPAPNRERVSSGSILGLENLERPRFETDPYAVKPVSMGNPMFDLDPAEERRSNAIHGPSFLGLSDPDFLDEEDEEPSHSRRNWLLAALAIVIVIGAVQWRNIRDTGMHYAGTLHFNLPLKKGEGQAQVAQEKAVPSDSGENSPAAEGKPEMEVNPTTSGAAASNSGDAPKPSQENLLTAQPEPSKAAESGGSDKSSSATATAKDQAQPPSPASDKSNGDVKATDLQKSAKKSSERSAGNTEVAEARAPKTKSERVSHARDAEPPATPAPGSEDVARAMSASDPATAANWLWAATKKGNKEAPVLLADYYAKGRGVPKDCEQATILLRSAARAGNPRASARLGMYYATGQCVAQNRAEAWRWLSEAHEKDPNSDWVEQYRRRLWSEMTPDERARSGSGPRASE